MHFDKAGRYGWIVSLGLCCLALGMITGCKDNIAEQDDVLPEVQPRVQQTILPDINAEAAAVLRQLGNTLAILPQVCATPQAEIADMATRRDFPTFFPTLAQPAVEYDDAGGEWILRWSDVLLGDNDLQRADSTATPADLTITAMFRGQNEAALLTIPFSLAAQTSLQTVGVPAAFTTGNTEGFFLSQDATSGAWSLRWRGGNNSVFAGTLNAFTGISRLIRHLPDSANSVGTLGITENTQEVTFHETTTAGQENGFTFYVRPGDAIQFRLRLGTSNETLHDITANDLSIGARGDRLPAGKAAPDFSLASNVPFAPTGTPDIALGRDRGTFLWQDMNRTSCATNEDQWRLRFTSMLGSDTFSGKFTGENDFTPGTLKVTPVAPCPDATLQDDGRTLNYRCTLGNGQLGGYDVCAPAGTRMTAEPRNNDVREPRMVLIGAERLAPPSPDPFSIRFEVELEERNSARHVKFSDVALLMHGNNPDSDLKLDGDQVSLEPPCVDGERLRARLTDQGDYSTNRFEGSRFILDQVEFLDRGLFPNRGVIQLRTRVEQEDTEIDAFMETIPFRTPERPCSLEENICVATTVRVTVNKVIFTFENQPAVLTAD